MICGPQTVFLLDSVSTGLDSSTTFDIMNTLKVQLPGCCCRTFFCCEISPSLVDAVVVLDIKSKKSQTRKTPNAPTLARVSTKFCLQGRFRVWSFGMVLSSGLDIVQHKDH